MPASTGHRATARVPRIAEQLQTRHQIHAGVLQRTAMPVFRREPGLEALERCSRKNPMQVFGLAVELGRGADEVLRGQPKRGRRRRCCRAQGFPRRAAAPDEFRTPMQ